MKVECFAIIFLKRSTVNRKTDAKTGPAKKTAASKMSLHHSLGKKSFLK